MTKIPDHDTNCNIDIQVPCSEFTRLFLEEEAKLRGIEVPQCALGEPCPTLPPKEIIKKSSSQFKEYYSTRSVQIKMNEKIAECGIDKRGCTHILRHSRLTHMIQSGIDISYVRLFARHESIKTTNILIQMI